MVWWSSGALGVLAALQLLVTGYALDVVDYLKGGDLLLQRGDMQGALQEYSNAVTADPKSKVAYTKRAAASAGIGNLHAAARDYNTALEIEPASVSTRMNRAQLFLRMCKYDDAEQDFNVVLEAKPEHDGAKQGKEKVTTGRGHLQTAEVLVDSGDFKGAGDALSRLNKVSADCTTGRLLAARMYLNEGNYEKVSWEAGRLLKSEPSNVQALLMRGEAFFYLEEFEMAKRHFGEVITNYDPDNQEAMKLFKKAKKLLKDLTTAREKVQKKLWKSAEEPLEGLLKQIAPTHTSIRREIMIALAQGRFHLNRSQESIEEAVDEVLEAEYDESVLIVKVELMMKQGKYDQAHQTVKEVIMERFGGRAGGSIGQLYQRTEQALKKSKMKDYYKILGVSPDLDGASLKRAYRKLALQYHPDKVQEGDKAEAEAHFAELNEAYEVLSDPEKKRTWEMGEDPFRDEPQQRGHPGGFHFHHPGQHSSTFRTA